MTTVGVRELKTNASELLRQVREQGEVIDITYYGEVIARLIPAKAVNTSKEELASLWKQMDQLAQQVGANQQILQMPTMQLISVGSNVGQLAAKIASENQLRGAGAVYVATAQLLDVPLVSWDQEQLTRASNIISTAMPST